MLKLWNRINEKASNIDQETFNKYGIVGISVIIGAIWIIGYLNYLN